SIDMRTGGFTCMLRVAPGVEAPVHHHLGSIELIVMSGDICYDPSALGHAGDYMYEPAGDIHQPISPSGCVLFCVFQGPIAGLTDEGGVAGIVDAKSMLAMAAGHGAVSHVHR
ncbi:MAG: cupin domain-containing protein, partial [Pseudomonadota bacterium]